MKLLSALLFLSILSSASAAPTVSGNLGILPLREKYSSSDGSKELDGFLYENVRESGKNYIETFSIWAEKKGKWDKNWFGAQRNTAEWIKYEIHTTLKKGTFNANGLAITLVSGPDAITNLKKAVTGYEFKLSVPQDGYFSHNDMFYLDRDLFPAIFAARDERGLPPRPES